MDLKRARSGDTLYRRENGGCCPVKVKSVTSRTITLENGDKFDMRGFQLSKREGK